MRLTATILMTAADWKEKVLVHKANSIAKNIYVRNGFVKIKDSDYDSSFEVMRLTLKDADRNFETITPCGESCVG